MPLVLTDMTSFGNSRDCTVDWNLHTRFTASSYSYSQLSWSL